MTLAAPRLDVACGQNRLFPSEGAAVRLFNGGGISLTAMTHDASELFSSVCEHGMLAIRLHTDIGETRFIQPDVATRAAIGDAKLRMPDLLKSRLKVALQRDGITAGPNHPQVAVLVMTPLTEVVFGRRDGEQHKQDRADGTKRTDGIAEQLLPHGRR